MDITIVPDKKIDLILEKIDQVLEKLKSDKETTARLYTDDDAARLLRVSKKTLFNWRNRGIIAFCQSGRKIYYTESNIQGFINANSKYKF